MITAEVPSTPPTAVLITHFLGSEAAAFYVEKQVCVRLGSKGAVTLVNSNDGGGGKYSTMPFAIGTAGFVFGRRGAGQELQPAQQPALLCIVADPQAEHDELLQQCIRQVRN